MRKNMVIFAVSLFLIFLLAGCAGPSGQVNSTGSSEKIELTLDELGKYNGKDGNPAYIAVDGVIYDVTESKLWKDGEHNGYTAGKDLTEEIKKISPHGTSVLKKMKEVGKIVQ
nr:cytochrome b5 domain-containing protein [uncultured Clostridium sp.]